MEEPKKETVGAPADAAHLTPEFVAAVIRAITGELSPPAADEIPGVLATTGEKVLVSAKPDGPSEISKFATGLLVTTPNRLKSRKLWVTVGTLGGLLAQLPMGQALPPLSQALICGLAAVYVIVQGILDALAEPKPLESAA